MIATLPSSNPMVVLLFRFRVPDATQRVTLLRRAGTWQCGPRLSSAPQARCAASGGRDFLNPAPPSLTQACLAALDHGDVARLYVGLERNDVAVLPQFHRHGLA